MHFSWVYEVFGSLSHLFLSAKVVREIPISDQGTVLNVTPIGHGNCLRFQSSTMLEGISEHHISPQSIETTRRDSVTS